MRIETERLILRPWREDDAAALFRYASDPEVGPAAGWAPHKSEEDSLHILRTVLMDDHTWAITIAPSERAVGSIGIPVGKNEKENGEHEIGYWIGKPFWGNGYVPEAVRALLRLRRRADLVRARGGKRQIPPRDREMRLSLSLLRSLAVFARRREKQPVLCHRGGGV